jgi:DNA-binding transcriptional LysR family regulator
MDRATEMAIVAAILERGGFTAAGSALGLTPSAVSKAITRLEARLGVRLFERTTRRMVATPEGEAYAEAAKRILAEIEQAEAAVMEGQGRPSGRLRVNTGTAFLVHQLARVLPEFMAQYPDLHLDLTVSDHMADLVAEGADVAIRTGAVGDHHLAARRFAEIRRVICASPAYLERSGMPQKPSDLADHCCINVASSPSLSLWPFTVAGRSEVVETRGSVNADNVAGILALGLAGVGIVRLANLVVVDAVRKGLLVPLLTDMHVADPVPVSLVFPAGRQRLPRVRVFIDFMVREFKGSPWQVGA